ncbi:MAG: MBL fold metallo-hydrolase [Ruminococcaceae bacterium]|nr:MBL fold metallo-hydrolase [Oscillospiraceae bacterium]
MQDVKICCLYSGSGGNCTYVEAGGTKILIDAGKSAKNLCAALRSIGVEITDVDAILITHDHRDHTAAVRTLSHKFGIPIYMLLSSAEIYRGLRDEKLCQCLRLFKGHEFETDIKGLHVKAFKTPHDSLASVGYRLTFKAADGNEIAIGFATDTGHVTDEMLESFKNCYAAIIESNHDPVMLRKGPYPLELKQRISGGYGHLSNPECAKLACHLYSHGTRNIMLAHLSEENNTPELARGETSFALADESVNLKVADQNVPVWLVGQEDR